MAEDLDVVCESQIARASGTLTSRAVTFPTMSPSPTDPAGSPPEPQRSRSGILHFLDGLRYSLKGYKAAWVHAEAFRQEIVVFIAAVIVAVFVGDSAVERALLIGILFLVLIAELINSSIETVVDRIGTEHNELSGRAKDLASAAVFTAIIAAVVVWLLVIFG